MWFVAFVLVLVVPVLWMVVVHALGRYAFARFAKLPIERARLRVFIRIAGPGRRAGRLGVLAAGSVASYLGAVAVAFAFAWCNGVPTGTSAMVIGGVLAGFDAETKLRPGDRIVSVDGEPVFAGRPPSLSQLVSAKQGAAVTLRIRRAGESLEVSVQPKLDEDRDRSSAWLLGVRLQRQPEVATGAALALAFAFRAPIAQVRAIITGLIASVAGQLGAGDSDLEPGGPIRIVDEMRIEARIGTVAQTLAVYVATYAMLLLALVDLARAVALASERRAR